jgi:uncharacterized protein (DUF924 family)
MYNIWQKVGLFAFFFLAWMHAEENAKQQSAIKGYSNVVSDFTVQTP